MVKLTKISNVNCSGETTIPVDMIIYLSLYYLVDDLVHLPYLIRIKFLALLLGMV